MCQSDNIIKLFDTINTYLQNLNILKFEKLVIQRISLMMFKFNIGEVPKPISDLFMVNRFFHNHNTKSVGYLHTPQASYRTFSYIGTHFLESFVTKRVYFSYSKFKFLTKFYILKNEIPIIRLNVEYN